MAKCHNQKPVTGSTLDFENQLWAAAGYPNADLPRKGPEKIDITIVGDMLPKLATFQTNKQGLIRQLFPSTDTNEGN